MRQRYVAHLPAAGEILLFDRSWCNRAGVERMRVRSGIPLVTYRFSISDEERQVRFLAHAHDPLTQWKLSPMDMQSRRRWEDHTKAKQTMLERTHIDKARWWVVPADMSIAAHD